ncbi:aminoglycoside phosphotransferase family protein [Saccharothrix australiensis]|uniref:Streptomycin 6-kinase n=1 Tax=Saccharothrix australiensis TaxID=2072 RepID=A0A495W6U6_9PSEU|nr:aminoglycoside phosphotransferase family protein [Saccharothrix australiensis]RKT56994.1 streptomycin 6-kinase [Saccharothrix australiensis]
MSEFVVDPGFADRLRRRFGPEVRDWVRAAPALVERLAAEWGLTPGAAFADGSTSLAVACVTGSGVDAVLKLSPQADVIAEQDRVLRAFQPGGRVPAVFRSAPERGAVLLERLPGAPVTAPSARELADVLSGLHGAVAAPRDVVDRELGHGVEQFLVRTEARLGSAGVAGVVLPEDFARARRLRDRLVAGRVETVLLHGDLHYGNLLDCGPARGLVAIDPKSCVGEPCFDAVDWVLDGSAPAAGRIDDLVALTAFDGERLADWCRVAAPVLAVAAAARGRDAGALLEFGRS